MRIPVLRLGQIVALACGFGLTLGFLAALPRSASALTPSSPEVEASITRGIKFLDSDAANDDRYGARALQGICLLNHTADPAYPRVASAAERIQKGLGARDPDKLDSTWDIYSIGLSIIFFVERDNLFVKNKKPKQHQADVEFLLTCLQKRQKPHGGWGYEGKETGDTSMTQYGVLSSWIARNAGYNVPMESIESVATWLMRTQDPSGAFGYQGNLAPAPGAMVAQSEIRPSMTAAGSGSLYVCADMLGFVEEKEKRKDISSAFKEVKKKGEKKAKPKSTKVDVRIIRETEARAKTWLAANTKLDGIQWTHYYLYALERCMSFRDFFEQKQEQSIKAEPQWYNEGAAYLMKNQAENGSWSGGQCGAVPDTAFGVLFLMRSTQKIITEEKAYGEGTMIGGHGIPAGGMLTVDKKTGNLKARPMADSSGALIALIEQQSGQDFDSSIGILADLPGSEVETLTSKYGDKIRQLVGNKSPEARRAAVKALGKTRDLDNVETLIYALTDPDPTVVRYAHEGLLRIRRITTESTLPDTFSEEDRRLLVEKWKNWYHSIRPGVEMR